MEDKENIIKTFRLFDEHNIQVGTEQHIIKDGMHQIRQKSCTEFDPREWRYYQVVKHSYKLEV